MKFIVLTISLLLIGCSSEPEPNILEVAFETCREDNRGTYPADIASDRTSVHVRGVGEDASEVQQVKAIVTIVCLLEETQAPSSVMSRMETTRALDGQQEARTNDITYRWSYHPNNGMDVLIELNPSAE